MTRCFQLCLFHIYSAALDRHQERGKRCINIPLKGSASFGGNFQAFQQQTAQPLVQMLPPGLSVKWQQCMQQLIIVSILDSLHLQSNNSKRHPACAAEWNTQGDRRAWQSTRAVIKGTICAHYTHTVSGIHMGGVIKHWLITTSAFCCLCGMVLPQRGK